MSSGSGKASGLLNFDTFFLGAFWQVFFPCSGPRSNSALPDVLDHRANRGLPASASANLLIPEFIGSRVHRPVAANRRHVVLELAVGSDRIAPGVPLTGS